MSQLKSDLQISGNGIGVKLSGAIDVTAKFPDLAGRVFAFLDIDMENVTAINSMGIRLWISWVKSFISEKMQVRFHKVPVPIMDQINKVVGFLPSGAAVRTCMVPLFCEKCGKDSQVLIDLKNAATPQEVRMDIAEIRKKSCAQGDCELTCDIAPERYFSFLTRRQKD